MIWLVGQRLRPVVVEDHGEAFGAPEGEHGCSVAFLEKAASPGVPHQVLLHPAMAWPACSTAGQGRAFWVGRSRIGLR